MSASVDTTPQGAPRWLSPAEQATWRAYLQMQDRLNGQLNRELIEHSGISGPDFAVLVRLSEHAGCGMRARELARALGWEKSRLSHQLSRMQQRGLVERLDCSEDRRGAFVALTPHGRETVESAAHQHVRSVRSYLFDDLDATEVREFGDLCRSVLAKLDALDAGRGAPACDQDEAACDTEVGCDSA